MLHLDPSKKIYVYALKSLLRSCRVVIFGSYLNLLVLCLPLALWLYFGSDSPSGAHASCHEAACCAWA